MTSATLEELRKKFIVETRLNEQIISEYVKRALHFGKVSKDGSVIIEEEGIRTKDKVALALAMRFLANHLDKEIPVDVNAKELSQSLGIPEDQVRARAKELVEENFAIRSGKGLYRANQFLIGKLLDYLEGKYKGQRSGRSATIAFDSIKETSQ